MYNIELNFVSDEIKMVRSSLVEKEPRRDGGCCGR